MATGGQEVGPAISVDELLTPDVDLTPYSYDLMRHYLDIISKKQGHQEYLKKLSPNVHKKVLALKKLQVKAMHLEAEFYQKVFELEQDLLKQSEEVFNKRSDIVNGNYVPTEEECSLNPSIAGISGELSKISAENNGDFEIKGIPDFWLTILKYVPGVQHLVKEYDEPVLKNLSDVKVRLQSTPHFSFILEFHFKPNEYFDNAVLEKEYFMKCVPEESDLFVFEGPMIYKLKGTKIQWKNGKNVTVDKLDGKTVESFFNFFSSPDNAANPQDQDVNEMLKADFEIGRFFKECLVPKAVLYFTGEVKEDMDDSSGTSSNLEVVYEGTTIADDGLKADVVEIN